MTAEKMGLQAEDIKIYFAPMEGITDFTFRNIFAKHYGGVDRYYTPFLSPKEKNTFTGKENNEMRPDNNRGLPVVLQLLTNDADKFISGINVARELGYGEVNLNLGCPSGTVSAKYKGSGFLRKPEELDNFFGRVFDALSSGKTIEDPESGNSAGNAVKISVKTRLGYDSPEEFGRLLSIYNKYPISELTVHPRIRNDFYREPVRTEFFGYALEHSRIPLCYNGDINTAEDYFKLKEAFPGDYAVMIGRGLIRKPYLANEIRAALWADENKTECNPVPAGIKADNAPKTFRLTREYHDELFEAYEKKLSGPVQLISRMKEFWFYFSDEFENPEKTIKYIRKVKTVTEYKSAVRVLFSSEVKPC